MKQSIAVIGQGFVGGTLTTVFAEHGMVVYPFDKSGKYVTGASQHDGTYPTSILDLVLKCESTPSFTGVYFVSH